MKKSKLATAFLTITLGIGTGVIDGGYYLSTPILAHAAAKKNVSAEANDQSDFKWQYNTTDHTATLTGLNIWVGQSGHQPNVVIPDTVKDSSGAVYKVTSIGNDAFRYQDGMTSVVLPQYLTSIGKEAFPYLKDLTSVDFSQATQLKTIGDLAFVSLQQTTPLTIPDSVTSIGNSAFIYGKMSQVTLGKNVETIGDQAFLGMDNLSKLVLNAKLTTIGAQAFLYNKNITSVNFGDATSLKTINNGAFEYTGLSGSVSLNSPLQTIGNQAFAANKITSVTLPDTLTTIGDSAFVYNQIAGTIVIPKGVTAVGVQAFTGNKLSGVQVVGSPTIGSDAFSYNNITKLNGSTAKLPTSGAIGQSATITAEQATLKIGDLFDVDMNSKSSLDLSLTNLTNGVTYDAKTGVFDIPAGVKQFSFSWSLKDGGDIIYSGNYTVFREVPKIAAHPSTVYVGDNWSPKDNYDGQDFDKLTVTIKDSDGNTISNSDSVTGKAGDYTVTYAYGNDETSIIVSVVKRPLTYSLTGSQAVNYNGSVQQPTPGNYAVIFAGLNQGYTPKDGEIAVTNNSANPGTYPVTLTTKGQSSLDTEYGEKYALTATPSSASFTIVKAEAIASLASGTKAYDGNKVSQSGWQPTLTVTSDNSTVGTITLTPTEYDIKNDDSAVGSYDITLNQKGAAAVQQKYPNYTFTNLNNVHTTYTITSAKSTSTLSGGTKVYDGKTVSQTFEPTLTLKDSAGKTVDTLTLKYGQYTLDKNDSADVGKYTVKLSDSEIAAIQAKHKNYTFDNLKTISTTYTITPKAVTASLESGTKPYDGQTVTQGTWRPTLTLKDGNDVVKTITLSAGQYTVDNDSSAVGDYTVRLSADEIKALKSDTAYANYDLGDLASVTGKFSITAQSVKAELSGGSKIYDGKKVSESNFTPTLTLYDATGNVLANITIKPNQYTVQNDSANVGSYLITLTADEINAIKAAYPLYDVDGLKTVQSTYIITKQQGKSTLSGGSKVYDGKPIGDSNYRPTLTLIDANGKSVGTIQLIDGQYTIENNSGAAGTYTVRLSASEIAALNAQYPNYDFGLGNVTATFTITSPDNHGGGDNTGGGSDTPSDNNGGNDNTNPTPNVISKKGSAVYSIKKIGLYASKNFSKSSRLTWYTKKPRINRPMFVVTGYARDQKGNLRYKVRDVNHLSKTRNKTGYITANWQYVRAVYYQSKHTKITVINPRGVNGYKNPNQTGKVKNYKQGTVLKVRKIVSHNLTTRFVLDNGEYVTGNRKLVQMGRHGLPKTLKAKGAINRYSNAGLTKRNKHYAKSSHKVFKVYGFSYSHANSMTKHGTLRYRVAGGYITGNAKYVKLIK
ncbi:MBG domain-containing protein [Lentilactobacillus sunkii]|uniref:Uncharacterized protein n=1 Tax=Lentilactobacillus sunkii DSM 19904 TaxID=1423808 RepID=A0A0R1L200_9LACO|nr:MBG domain-containing protein [Lentilactobacillus sunkii]KRK87076.1 hypothetical protein FD17_GL001472 [Lentilactobacillus sunkii DSM 19904]